MTQPPSFKRSLGTLWLFTLLRFGLFAVVWGILYAIGLEWFLAAVIALVLSIPLSLVLLAKPRAMLSQTIEQRIDAQKQRRAELDARLDGDDPT
jgi:membrane protein implicated in regulation of membrane protease activity